MNQANLVACVTGASGLIGRRIVQSLLIQGYRVRALSRRKDFVTPEVELFCGGLEDEAILKDFLRNAQMLFHCAAEVRDHARMWEVNVLGTERLLRLSAEAGIEYLCHFSSAGVVGRTREVWVDEETPCHPRNLYEKSKWAAERLAAQGVGRVQVVILRPTNVIDGDKLGALALPQRGSWSDRLQVLIKGGECAHIIHADDVAAAAVYFISHPADLPQIFFVSYDQERLNTFAGLWSLYYKAMEQNMPTEKIQPAFHLPIYVPYLIRKLCRGTGNLGNVRYSSAKLLSTGFKFHLGVEGAIRRIIASRRPITS